LDGAVLASTTVELLANLGIDQAALDYLKNQPIKVEFHNLRPPEYGFYAWYPGAIPVIGLAEHLKADRVRLRCVLWEELGHHATAPESLRRRPFVLRSTTRRGSHDPLENGALRWAAVQLISAAEIRWWLFAGGGTLVDLAEVFRVTPEMARERLNALQANQPGLWRKIILGQPG
jgi:hypothetical protein